LVEKRHIVSLQSYANKVNGQRICSLPRYPIAQELCQVQNITNYCS